MSFYVLSTPEVAAHLGFTYTDTGSFYFVSGTFVWSYSGSYLQDFKNNYKDIPEYKLHPVHGLIPADSKLFKEANSKEQEETQMKQQETKKAFEVGDKCIIRNPNNYEVMKEVKKHFIDKECKIVAKFDLSLPMVVVQLVEPEDSDMFGVCVVFREEMCYPVKTYKEKTIDKMKEVCDYKGSWSSLYQQFASDLYDAGFRFEGDVE